MADWLRLNWVADARLSSKHCSAQPISLGCLHGRAPHAFRPRLRCGLVLTTGYFRPALAATSGSVPPEETVSASPKMAVLGPSTTTNVSPAGTGKSCDCPLGWPITTCRWSVMTLRHAAPEKAHFESVRGDRLKLLRPRAQNGGHPWEIAGEIAPSISQRRGILLP